MYTNEWRWVKILDMKYVCSLDLDMEGEFKFEDISVCVEICLGQCTLEQSRYLYMYTNKWICVCVQKYVWAVHTRTIQGPMHESRHTWVMSQIHGAKCACGVSVERYLRSTYSKNTGKCVWVTAHTIMSDKRCEINMGAKCEVELHVRGCAVSEM